MRIFVQHMSLTDVDTICALDNSMGDDAIDPSILRTLLTAPVMTLLRLMAVDDDGIVLGYAIASFEGDLTQIVRLVVQKHTYAPDIAGELLESIKDLSYGITCRVVAHARAVDTSYIDVLRENDFHVVHEIDMSMLESAIADCDVCILESPVDEGGKIIDEILYGDCKTLPFQGTN